MKFPKQKRYRSKAYLKKVAALPCVICGRDDIVQAHHEIGTKQRGMGLRSPDDRTLPLCPQHHDELHRWGVETWERMYGKQADFIEQTQEALK